MPKKKHIFQVRIMSTLLRNLLSICLLCWGYHAFALIFLSLQNYAAAVKELIPNGDFVPMIKILKKFLNFMSLTVCMLLLISQKKMLFFVCVFD